MREAELRGCGGGGERAGERAEEEGEEKDLAAEPGAPPHLERAVRVGRTSEVESRKRERAGGDAEQHEQAEGIERVPGEQEPKRAGDGLHERRHVDEGDVGVLALDLSEVDALEASRRDVGQRDAGGGDGLLGGGHAGRLGERRSRRASRSC